MNGDTDAHIPPTRYLQPGPDQHLNGFDALWFARGRYGSDDYQRMDRQRCMIQAIAEKANPLNLLRNYQDVAKAGTGAGPDRHPARAAAGVRRPGPEGQGAPAEVRGVPLDDSFNPGDPDFDYVHETVAKALAPHRHHAHRPPAEQDNQDACAYHPVS